MMLALHCGKWESHKQFLLLKTDRDVRSEIFFFLPVDWPSQNTDYIQEDLPKGDDVLL